LQFSVRHEWLRVTGRQRTSCALVGCTTQLRSPACELSVRLWNACDRLYPLMLRCLFEEFHERVERGVDGSRNT
jgi:hypothetical protein